MYRKCSTEVSVQNQQKVTAGLLKLMQETPYEDITVSSLCQCAGITRRIFYHLFSNKTDALYALIDNVILGIEGYRLDVADETLRFFLFWREQKAFFDALYRNGLSNLLPERMITCVLDEAYDVRYWLKAYDPDTATDIIIFHLCGIMGLTYSWYRSGYQKTPEEMAVRIKQLTNPDPSLQEL
jgi:AcrR family transcriptional regulator